MNKNTNVIKALMKLGASYPNAYRIVNDSKGHAASMLVALIRDLIDRGIEIR